jgi:hypothetical protein
MARSLLRDAEKESATESRRRGAMIAVLVASIDDPSTPFTELDEIRSAERALRKGSLKVNVELGGDV